MVSKWYL